MCEVMDGLEVTVKYEKNREMSLVGHVLNHDASCRVISKKFPKHCPDWQKE